MSKKTFIKNHNYLNSLRLRDNYTVAEVAKLLDIPKGTCGGWFSGTLFPHAEGIIKLANLFGEDIVTVKSNICKDFKRDLSDVRGRRGPVGPYSFKDTFWSKMRVEAGLTLKEVAEAIGVSSEKTLGNYFSGQSMPSERMIATLCDLFDVNLLKGTQEFTKAHKAWDSERQRSIKYRKDKPSTSPEESAESETGQPTILELVYRKVPYDVFIKICQDSANTRDILELIYGKVSCDVFNYIYSMTEV